MGARRDCTFRLIVLWPHSQVFHNLWPVLGWRLTEHSPDFTHPVTFKWPRSSTSGRTSIYSIPSPHPLSLSLVFNAVCLSRLCLFCSHPKRIMTIHFRALQAVMNPFFASPLLPLLSLLRPVDQIRNPFLLADITDKHLFCVSRLFSLTLTHKCLID